MLSRFEVQREHRVAVRNRPFGERHQVAAAVVRQHLASMHQGHFRHVNQRVIGIEQPLLSVGGVEDLQPQQQAAFADGVAGFALKWAPLQRRASPHQLLDRLSAIVSGVSELQVGVKFDARLALVDGEHFCAAGGGDTHEQGDPGTEVCLPTSV